MRVTEIDFNGPPPVDGFGPGFIRVRGVVHQGCVLVGPDGAEAWAGLPDVSALVAMSGQIDLVLIGMGAEIATLDAGVRAELAAAGLAVEFMATPSACRTYNMLLAERRRVAVAVMPL
jgi:uncharacterized protein